MALKEFLNKFLTCENCHPLCKYQTKHSKQKGYNCCPSINIGRDQILSKK